ncbi:putative cell polarity protein [Eutypa lata UCREL1]|uniref:Putative cell polarity protein n=1 Tax=Eutypa lata (strain UCR-EL1) TaxID=1287681 RepID=M7SV74_EUTLA|nr:putative cell polarity protein [Eutypa lata UCREL1]
MNGFPSGPKSVGGPSPPPSIAARTSYARSESGRSIMGDSTEAVLEEDDDGVGSNDGDNEYGMGQSPSNRESKRSAGTSDTDKKLIDDYQVQVRDLREKLDSMEDQMKKKEDEMNSMLDEERSRATVSNSEKQEWDDVRMGLENKVAEAQNLNDSMRDELDRLRDDYDRMRDDHAMESRKLREELEDAQQNSRAAPAVGGGGGSGDPDLMRENEDLRMALENQQRVTEEARYEARQFLQEMKVLSEQHSPAWERQAELEKTVEKLEQEVKDWTNRYARTKTQLRDLRASSMGLTVDQDAAKYLREKGFVEDNGLVKDIHVTKFQISIDELLHRARTEEPDKVIDSMKAVVVSVRRITKDIDGSSQHDEEAAQQQQKLKARVSATANNLITASKNFASSAGISPVSLLDAAASHLVAALVELFRTVKIRPTPADELEDEGDGTVTPVDSTAFFSNRSTQQDGYGRPQDSPLAPPPPFQGLRGARDSAQSSAYSSASSPRQSGNQYQNGINGNGGMGYMNGNRGQTNGYHQDTNTEDLIIYLSNQKDVVVQTSQGLVNLVRGGEASTVDQFNDAIASIAQVVDRVVSEMESEPSGMADDMVERLSSCRERLLEAGDSGRNIAAFRDNSQTDEDDKKASAQWRMWIQTLPPIAFKIVHQIDELIAALGGSTGVSGRAGDDFS